MQVKSYRRRLIGVRGPQWLMLNAQSSFHFARCFVLSVQMKVSLSLLSEQRWKSVIGWEWFLDWDMLMLEAG